MGLTTGKAVVLIYVKKISSSVGVLDMKQAYRKVMEILPLSNATSSILGLRIISVGAVETTRFILA
jgi:hypothetical protein